MFDVKRRYEAAAAPRRRADESHLEAEAERVGLAVGLGRQPSPQALMSMALSHVSAQGRAPSVPSGGAPPPAVTALTVALTGSDLYRARLHTDAHAHAFASREGALAVTRGNDIYFAQGTYRPDLPLGRALLAHELTHVAQQLGPAPLLAHQGAHEAQRAARPAHVGVRLQRCRRTPTAPAPSAPTDSFALAQAAASTFDHADRLSNALAEIREGHALEYHRNQSRELAAQTARESMATPDAIRALAADWTWFLEHGPPPPSIPRRRRTADAGVDAGADAGVPFRATDAEWAARREAFLRRISSLYRATPAASDSARRTVAQRLNDTPRTVFDVLRQAAGPNVSAPLLYSFAMNEGLIDVYVRGQVGLGREGPWMNADQRDHVSVSAPISGYGVLGTDRYFDELTERRQPLRGFLPTGFDESRIQEERHRNERGEEVRSVRSPDLLTSLQVMAAIIARRQALFNGDRTRLNYSDPTEDERVLATYIYYNPGQNHGRRLLERQRPDASAAPAQRSLGSRINFSEYPDAQRVLLNYRVVRALSLF
ncbi:MAG: hypothetical protein JWM10_358 [Myxococcaceae bacterium]|nr:hypothetical protein [Myxococcaceae bacterium]